MARRKIKTAMEHFTEIVTILKPKEEANRQSHMVCCLRHQQGSPDMFHVLLNRIVCQHRLRWGGAVQQPNRSPDLHESSKSKTLFQGCIQDGDYPDEVPLFRVFIPAGGRLLMSWLPVMLSDHEKSSRKRFCNRSEWFVEIPGKMGLNQALIFSGL